MREGGGEAAAGMLSGAMGGEPFQDRRVLATGDECACSLLKHTTLITQPPEGVLALGDAS